MSVRVLLLGSVPVLQDVKDALEGLSVRIAETYDAALAELEAHAPEAIVLAYHFDQLRPFRLVQHVRGHDELSGLPIILVRIISIELGTTKEAELEEAYRGIGVDDFLNLQTEIEQHGRAAALQRLRDAVLRLRA